MSYSKRATRRSPKLVIFLIDESTSMLENSGAEPKHVVVDRAVNSAIEQLVTVCNRAEGVRDFVELGVVGYGGRDRDNPTLRSLLNTRSGAWTAPLSAVAEMASVVDNKAQYVVSRPEGWTPMGAAVRLAGRLVNDWLVGHEDGPAPVIVNVTDGVPTDDDAPEGPVDAWAAKLEGLSTSDGACLLLNVGAPAVNGARIERSIFPTSAEIPTSQGADRLWRISSPLGEDLAPRAVQKGLLVAGSTASDRRLFAQGTDESLLDQIFDFGTEVRPH